MEITKQFIAVRAVIVKENKVLIIREATKYEGGTNHGKYDFPGGKVKVGESIQDAITREIKEEIGASVKIKNAFFVDEWRPIVKNEHIQIIGIFFECELEDGSISLSADHDDYKWVDEIEYKSYPLIDATHKALVAFYSKV